MKIAVVHHTLNSLGGGERIAASTIQALNSIGIVPDLYSTTPYYTNYLEDFYGKKVRCRAFNVLPVSIKAFGIYQRLLSSANSFRLAGYDVVLNTTGVYTPMFFKRLIRKYILYVYNPLIPVVNMPLYKENLKYHRSLFWKIYWTPYINVIRRSVKNLNGVKLLAVSKFTKLRIEKYWRRGSEAVEPPIDVDAFAQVKDNTERDGVISVARFSPEKNHEIQLEIAKKLPQHTFRICGSAKNAYYSHWLQNIRAKAEAMNLRNVEFYPNIRFSNLVKLIGESKYFLHTMFYEDFGISTCEGIAGGCIPAVHDSGGQREVVPLPNLRFKTVDEAVKILSRDYPEHVKQQLQHHIQQYREENFQKKMLNAILDGEWKIR